MKRTLRNLARSGPVILGMLAVSLLMTAVFGRLAHMAITDSDYWWPLRAVCALALTLGAAGAAWLAFEIIKDAAA
jgi:O-antigen/teichoic acid export membrane protein